MQPASGGQTGRRAQQIGESQQQGQSLPVFVLAAVADLVIAEVPFHGAKRMLHFGPQRGLGPLHPRRRAVRVQGAAHPRPQGDMPVHVPVLVFRPFGDALIAGIPPHQAFAPVQQLRYRGQIVHMGGRGDQTVHQPRHHVPADVQLHAEIPVVARARLVHLRIPGFLLILGRGGGRDQRGIYDSTLAQAQSAGGQMLVDAAEQDLAQGVPLPQMAKVEYSGFIWNGAPQAQTRTAPQRFNFIQIVFPPQVTAMVKELQSMHP